MAQFFNPRKASRSKPKNLQIQELDTQGQGVAFTPQGPLFVAGALPGDQVVVTMQSNARRRARLQRVSQPSAQRINPPCAVAEQCGGCALMALPHEAQLTYKQQALNKLLARYNLQPKRWEEPLIGDSLRYRRRARLAIDARGKSLKLGFRRSASHQILGLQDCPVLVEALAVLLRPLQQCLDGLQSRTQLGHVELLTNHQQTMVLIRHNGTLPAGDRSELHAFAQQWQCALHVKDEQQLQVITGPETLSENVADSTIEYRTGDFVQVNKAINQRMVKQALEWLDLQPEQRVADLFCGVGNFTFALAKQCAEVVAVEGVAQQVERLQQAAESKAITNIQAICRDLFTDFTDAAWWQAPLDAVLLDPARAGAEQAVQNIANKGIKRVVYVSCNPATLVRDAAILMNAGYRVDRAALIDMFPHTTHVESMLQLSRD